MSKSFRFLPQKRSCCLLDPQEPFVALVWTLIFISGFKIGYISLALKFIVLIIVVIYFVLITFYSIQ